MTTQIRADVTNIAAVARREFLVRVRARTYIIGTIILLLAAGVVALAPVGIAYLNRDAAEIGVHVGAADLRADPVATLDALFNTRTDHGGRRAFTITRAPDLDVALGEVTEGRLAAVLDIERDSQGLVTFTVYTLERPTSATAVLSRQAATSIAIADRLARLGLPTSTQATLFAGPDVAIRHPDPAKPAIEADALTQQEADAAILFALETFLLLAIVLYGMWIAQSVVEEKSSRIMEIVLTAANPLQLLAGKVLGVSAAALLQFAGVLAATAGGLIVQDQIAGAILGQSAAITLPSGLTPSLIVGFTGFFILGFILYAALFAMAGSLVSRQEDVSQVVQPATFVACAGFFVAVYASIGTLDAKSPIVIVVSWLPFTSPYAMLSRLAGGEASLLEGVLAVGLLAVTAAVFAWIAARVYAASVLLYGQKPGLRALWTSVRSGH